MSNKVTEAALLAVGKRLNIVKTHIPGAQLHMRIIVSILLEKVDVQQEQTVKKQTVK